MIVADSSVAAKLILIDENGADKALALAQSCAVQGETIVAPPLLLSEVTNVIRQRMRLRGLLLADTRQLLGDFMALPIAVTAPAGLYDQALQVADQYNLPATYDAQYVALAQMLGCDLWTADQRLLNLGIDVNAGWFGPQNLRDGDPPLALIVLRGSFDVNRMWFMGGYRGASPAGRYDSSMGIFSTA